MKARIRYLLEAYSSGKATPEEEQELFEWLVKGNQLPVNEHIRKLVSNYNSGELVPSVDWERLYEKVVQEKNNREAESHRVHKTRWLGWAAAAAVLLFFGTGYLFFYAQKRPERIAKIHGTKTNDIAAPNAVNAVLTLSNGQKIIFDSTGNGIVATQGAVNVIKTADGQITYQGSSDDIAYNTLSNPRGSKVIGLTLADGSKVWLNAASSLTYPTAFVGKERKVQITGEAYFEVTHHPDMPFIVDNGKASVQVLGTHFNVNAYDDERSVNVTLLEGSVSLTTKSRHQPTLIKPGEQATVDEKGGIAVSDQVNIQEVIAWKNGIFSYNGVDIETIMRQISRWYNVDVVFDKPVTEKFFAEAPRDMSVSVLLKMLEATKAVHFKIDGNTINVSP